MTTPQKTPEQLALEHWEWLSTLLEKVYKDAFIHGFKHGKERVSSLRYAQEKGGQKLHLVSDFGDGTISSKALCGKQVHRWRLSINVPLAHACRNCIRVHNARK